MTQKHYRDIDGEYGTLSSPVAHKTIATIGRANDLLFNSWDSGYYPYYDSTNSNIDDQFVQVIGIGQIDDDTGKYRFAVYDDGTVCATQARIAGRIVAQTGSIGGWTIGSDLHAGSGSSYVALSTSGIWAGNNSMGSAPFRVTNTGALTATDATITGTITATSGTIGGWTIDKTNNNIPYLCSASSSSMRMYLAGGASWTIANGSPIYTNVGSKTNLCIRVGENNTATFGVGVDGAIYATLGNIAGWNISTTRLSYGTLGSSGGIGLIPQGTTVGSVSDVVFTAGANFKVTKTGILYATAAHITGEITATSGTIGNVHIGTPSSGGTVGLYSVDANMANTCGQGVSSSSFYLGSNGLSFDLGSTDSDNYHGYTSIMRPAMVMLYGNGGSESS